MLAPEATDLPLRMLRGLLLLFLLLIGIAILAMALITAAAGIDHDVMVEIAGPARNIASTSAFALFAAIMACGMVLLLLAVTFVRHLLAILDSVGAGDPFIPANAKRLDAMARTMLAIVIGGFALEMFARWLEARYAFGVSVDIGNPAGGLMLVLVLFVLARVFAHGTALREDLEGTV
ncbi:DUF2975 domain-containing protein [Sphingosinithalassobacter portus]|uniref:DUF2975 domain-containing protein n=1 Tax=Stakelama portus TaxID=2676234 RepID=UPI00137976D5|nr:DUF2975 domain-containing protein [Sphingosinithalassobacter portus]